jgi:hypothetical protein
MRRSKHEDIVTTYCVSDHEVFAFDFPVRWPRCWWAWLHKFRGLNFEIRVFFHPLKRNLFMRSTLLDELGQEMSHHRLLKANKPPNL